MVRRLPKPSLLFTTIPPAEITEVAARGALDQLSLVILSGAKRSRRISVQALGGAVATEIQRCFAFAQHDNDAVPWENGKWTRGCSDQSALSEIAEIAA